MALAAILMSAGFFLASAGKDRTEPNGLITLVYLGAASLEGGTLTPGFALITSKRGRAGHPRRRSGH